MLFFRRITVLRVLLPSNTTLPKISGFSEPVRHLTNFLVLNKSLFYFFENLKNNFENQLNSHKISIYSKRRKRKGTNIVVAQSSEFNSWPSQCGVGIG